MFRYEPPDSNDMLMNIVANRRGYLGIERFNDLVLDAMRRTDRALFAEPTTKHIFEDEPFCIGENQTCSQPSMVAAMATLLELEPGMHVLEIGTGCGYSAVVTSCLLGPEGTLDTIEFVEALSLRARERIGKHFPDLKIRYHVGDGSVGLPAYAPFDRIFMTAGAGRYFDDTILLKQLPDEGILLYPESFGSMFLVRKTKKGTVKKELPGVGFVALRGENSGYR